MGLSIDASRQSSWQPPQSGAPRLLEFEVPLPAPLFRFCRHVPASLHGVDGGPVVVVLGGISANRFPCVTADGSNGWWSELAGQGGAVDPANFRILGIDFAADETGRIAPSTHDQAQVICAVLNALDVDRAHAIVGASYGGMAALSFAELFADRVERLVVVSAPAEPHPAATAVRELQRRVVALGIAGGQAHEGLALARGLAMLTYRTPAEFEARFTGGIEGEDVLSRSQPGAYLHARGEAYHSLVSPERFLSLSASIDRHRINPEQIDVPALMIGSASDQLIPPSQMQALASRYGGPVSLHLLPSLYGHDMFLKDVARLSQLIDPFLRSQQ